MVPIFEQGTGEGIGHSLKSFLTKFIEICEEHKSSGRAKAFVFLVHDFNDNLIVNILKSRGGFAQLDRLSGEELSVFYLQSNDKKTYRTFNNIFLEAFGTKYKANLPFMLFFKIEDKQIVNVKIVELEQTDSMFALNELCTVIESYINTLQYKESPKINKFTNLINQVKTKSVDKLIDLVVDKGIDTLL